MYIIYRETELEREREREREREQADQDTSDILIKRNGMKIMTI